MHRVSDRALVTECLERVLTQILGVHVLQRSFESGAYLSRDARWFTSLVFSGDWRGEAVMAFSDEDSRRAIAALLERIGVRDMAVDPDDAHKEMLNLFAGHMATSLESFGHRLIIRSPRAKALSPERLGQNATFVVRYEMGEAFSLAFYFFMEDGADGETDRE